MNFEPSHPATKVLSNKQWRVSSLEGLLSEFEKIDRDSRAKNKLIFYRGHKDKRWLLDSTFVRSYKTTLFGIEPFLNLTDRIRNSVEFHNSVLNLYLLKFGVLTRPSNELEENAQEHDLDSWFEFMKRIQQYPEEDGFFLKGTNLIDWSQSSDVALYFANESRTGEGAIFICDASATGKTLQTLQVGAILDLMSEKGRAGQPLGVPLIFHPKKQIANPRPENQHAVYFAQLDLRYDLQYMWDMYETENGDDTVCLKIILSSDTIQEITDHLKNNNINESYIYPDRQSGIV
jgi:hypothetical protein